MKGALLTLALSSVLAACVATPYQTSGLTGGFGEQQLKEDIWRVRFGGNGFTTRETAQTYWLYRCAEITLEKGYQGFEILSHIQLVLPVPADVFFQTEAGFSRTATPIYIPIYTDESNKPRIEADIRLLRRPFQAAPPKVFDAAELKTALEPRVKGEKCSAGETSNNVCPHVHEYLHPKGKFDKPRT
jgi:hypothetical protein